MFTTIVCSIFAGIVLVLWLGYLLYRKLFATPVQATAMDAVYPFALAAYHRLLVKYPDCKFLDKVEEFKQAVNDIHIDELGKFVTKEQIDAAVKWFKE